MQRERSLERPVGRLCFSAHKMALVSGPRQAGKTTLARRMLEARGAGAYHTWDDIRFRRAWATDPSLLTRFETSRPAPLIVLDEIHKDARWKRTLKGLYDTRTAPCDILVTGSARLNVYAKGGESMLGRYFHFRLHPFTLREMTTPGAPEPNEAIGALFSRAGSGAGGGSERLARLLRNGPFPEPLFADEPRRTRLWRRNREELVIREDLRDLSHIPDLARVEALTSLLPSRVGSPFSVAAMREDLETSFPSVARWIAYLKQLYYLFEVKPFAKRLHRSLRREGKIYLWDYGGIPDPGARFENLVGCHLLKACDYWTDTGEGAFDLHYLRTKEKEEIDFLVTKDGAPWLAVEAKLSQTAPSAHWGRFARALGLTHGLQLVATPHWREHREGGFTLLVADAAEALGYLV